MRFQLDHDWQGNISAPRAELGETAKTQLLLLLCAIWILIGLIGHQPWKPLESTSISIVKSVIDQGKIIAPLALGESALEAPPLYYLTAAVSASIFSPFLALHDGARLFNAIWLSILLLMVGMTGRELWSKGVGRHATFIMIGTIGLVLSAHSLNNQIAALASTATGFYALALCHRRPRRASALFGLALGIGFLCDGLIPCAILFISACTLFIFFKKWRNQRFMRFLVIACLIATPMVVTWLLLLKHHYSHIYELWLLENMNSIDQSNYLYFLRILIWYAWPALPLALIGLWRFKSQLLHQQKYQLIITFFVVCLLVLGFAASAKDINALPLLLPLVALGAGCVDHLKRDFAAALNWFGVILFAMFGILIWLGWIAMMTGHPAKIKERMIFLSGAYHIDFNVLAFAMAIFMTTIWFLVCTRAKLTKRSTVTNWAVGMTFVWSLLMTLWLPMIDYTKNYRSVFTAIQQHLPKNFSCINSLNVGKPQSYLFNYYTNLELIAYDKQQPLACNVYLIQDFKGTGMMHPGQEWQLIWQGKRAADRKESFRLFKLTAD